MPTHVEHRPIKGNRDWAIVEKSGRIVGRSTTHAKAQANSNARNASRHGWKPTRGR